MRSLLALFISVLAFSCNNSSKTPDVSNIKVELSTKRFEQELFKIDSANLSTQLEQLIAKYPSFGENYLSTILGADPRWPMDSTAAYVGGFINSYKYLYDTSQLIFKNFDRYEKEIKKGLQFVKYYFPQYKTPNKIITYIGPVDGYGDILADDAFLVGLQQHLGKTYSLYKSTLVQETYAEYISNRFEPEYISINCLKNITDDLFPEKNEDKPLVNQMIEKGKRLYLLSKFLPDVDEYKLIGYTKEQLADCYNHEAVIWDLFVKNSYLQVTDKNITKNYVDEGPKTQELGEKAPGNIGSFCGWQIVKKYMEKHNEISLPQLMATDAETIFQETKYKP
ncbi:hypothetical protein LK994_06750 [Ferruginibacter lapsinanis]|uniref:gliding motility lipoprotein GldB n=1 Tax=Ferruginibacter lapsinanis TaxID=563172 RepID=UPI001E345CBF|nr:hypothetical protein [Ferruginibacter lapsinanis]UEG51172.1 hypothetical protein LK994_06750 [Ferruginibacter lapsinanis]